ncbi:MAG: molybdopterin-dependent oxidoreductase [Rhodocyclaceae bacterium]|nr:molybdopterin-dependent oxidoreductase [Rhodocyclaceae bacterium]
MSWRRALDDPDPAVFREEGDVATALQAGAVVEAVYEQPYLAHLCMEPMNCTARVDDSGVTLWVGTQAASIARDVAAQVAGVSGGEGDGLQQLPRRRLRPARGNGLRAPCGRCCAGLAGATGEAPLFTRGGCARRHVPPGHRGAPAPGSMPAGASPCSTTCWRRSRSPPAISAGRRRHAVATHAPTPPPCPARPTCPTPASATCAAPSSRARPACRSASGAAPGTPRTALSSSPSWTSWRMPPARIRSLSAWRTSTAARSTRRCCARPRGAPAGASQPPAGQGRGLAFIESHDSLVAQVVEVAVDADAGSDKPGFRVLRVSCVIDPRVVIHPDTVVAQMEGGILDGLSAALYGRISIRGGVVEQGNFDDCRLLSLAETPEISVQLLPQGGRPGGVGEPGVPGLAPALANALFAATGRRLRSMPFRL